MIVVASQFKVELDENSNVITYIEVARHGSMFS